MTTVATTKSVTTSASAAAQSSVSPVGVLQGQNPLVYSSTDPLIIFIVQVRVGLFTD
jgi:hypothetical protein